MLLLGDAGEEILGERPDVLDTRAERREVNPDDIESIVEILAKLLGRDRLIKVAIRRGHDTDVCLDGGVATHTRKLTLLQDAKKFALDRHRHLTDLVEEKGPALALLKAPDTLGRRAGEGPLLVTEELAL